MRKFLMRPLPFLVAIFFIASYREANALVKNENTHEKDYIAMTKVGVTYLDTGETKKAVHSFKDAIKINPSYPMAHFFLGRAYFLMQDEDAAASELDIFREMAKKDEVTDDQTKEELIDALHHTCEIYFNLKRYENAKSAIEDILQIDPRDQLAYYNLGVYYYNGSHDRAKAYTAFKNSIDINPDNDTAKKAKYAIEFIRTNPDSRVSPDFSFIDQEYRD